jgi:hypothetical protein
MRKRYFLYLFLVFAGGCTSSADKIDFFLPKGFTGNCVVMYECKDGISPSKKDGIKQIQVPSTGIIKLQEKISYGEIKYRYFIANNKDYVELKTYQSFQSPSSDSFYIGPGTTMTDFSVDKNGEKSKKQSAFVFYVHKHGETISANYNDSWIKDTLRSQVKINESYR